LPPTPNRCGEEVILKQIKSISGKRAPAQSEAYADIVRLFRPGSAREAPGDERVSVTISAKVRWVWLR